MPRVRRRGHTLVDKNTPECWQNYYLAEIRARRFPLKLPRGAFFAFLGLVTAEARYDRERAEADGPLWWLKEQRNA
jgi:hypothetical protein